MQKLLVTSRGCSGLLSAWWHHRLPACGETVRLPGGRSKNVFGGALVRLSDGRRCHVPWRGPDSNFGTPLVVRVFGSADPNRPLACGEVVQAEDLDPIASDDRPLALIDANNLTWLGGPDGINVGDWRFGSAALFAAAWSLDRARFRPVVLCDPGLVELVRAHEPSARALAAMRNRFADRWPMLCEVDGHGRAHLADRAILRRATASGDAIIVSRDGFRDSSLIALAPWLATSTGRARLVAPRIEGDDLLIPKLRLRQRIPLGLFLA